MVALPGLVVEDRDGAGRAGAERILHGYVDVASGSQDWNVLGCVIRGAPDLVEVAAVRAVEGAHRAMRRDAGRSAGSINVARPRPGSRGF